MATKHNTPVQESVENGLGMVLLALVWLAPNHQAPWGSFHHDLLMAVFLTVTSFLLMWQTRWQLPVPLFATLVLLAALVPWIQWAMGLLPKSGTAFVSSSYIAALGIAICIGCAAARESSGQRLFDILFGALALAAFFNVPVQVVQWYQWYEHEMESWLMLFVTPIGSGSRPSGMILQPNQLATIQVWGLLGLSWFRYHRRISLPFFLLAFVAIVLGIGLTQSRAGLLEMVAVPMLMLVAWRWNAGREIVLTWFAAIVFLVVWAMNFPAVAEWMGVSSTAVARLSSIDGARIDAWRAFWGAVLKQPWGGYGVTDAGYAYVALASEHPEVFIGQRFAHAHNVLLDLVVWVGLPLGVLIATGFGIWLVRHLLAMPKLPQSVFPLAVLLALGLHAMLELPHQFLYFVVPAGICIGWLCGLISGNIMWTLPRWCWGAVGLGLLAVIAPITLDYFPYQERYTEWRFENKRIGKRPDIPVHQPLVLDQLHDELELYRMPLESSLPEDQLQWVADTARSVSSPPAFLAAVKAFALAGKLQEAQRWMDRFNAVMGPDGVRQVKPIWSEFQKRHPELAGLPWSDYKGRTSTFVMPPLDASPKLVPADSLVSRGGELGQDSESSPSLDR
ncbi:PglL family O-oligosaccharyltransferase [Hydrogenophaga sp.]|uniref:PglL family O-oligosaccharyltransferase n=1 Tax=Hydrogenophaga sp. TaxID=1904254 RepID=UPI00272FCF0D|nr:O-antigen ligase family protein [Hydrogenophaga sp.]MDP2074465.1 Wzy polymerase domain-containing protein [Hydrogenophaga sp.]MDP3349008.1 Wzy polymerase domain-containing protein [Hydrogenophaga sp.]